jgi:serine-type D-Ala-D-Ala carboxypeptidase/endopeptidase (penicillin-binding protein 4)
VKYFLIFIFLVTSCTGIEKIDSDGKDLKSYPDDFAYIIYDVRNNKVVAEQNSDTTYIPASIFKLFTNFAALEILGSDTKFSTNLYLEGKAKNGVLDGNLILEAGGDTTFFIENLYNFAFAVRAQGISKVEGKLLYYDGDFINTSTINSSQPSYASYNPGFSALNLNFNSFQVSCKKNVVATTPECDATLVQSSSNRYYTPVYKSDRWHINRKAKSLLLPVKNSSQYFASALQRVFANVGIKVEGVKRISSIPKSAKIIVSYESKSVKDTVKNGLVYSNNLYSEVLLVHIAKKLDCDFDKLEGASRCLQHWYQKNYPMMGLQNAKFYNGSGLSERIQISPKSVIELLKVAEHKKYGNDYFPSLLPLSAVSGTMKDRFVNDSARVFAKTGSMDFISSIAGYYYGANKEFLFIFISNNKKLRQGLEDKKVLPRFAGKWRKEVNSKHEELLSSFIEK